MPARRGRGRPPHPDVLTPTEWRVLDWVRHGVSRRQIAEMRGISENAVKYHTRNIAGKLGVAGSELRHWPGHPFDSALRRDREAPMAPSLQVGPPGQVSLLMTN